MVKPEFTTYITVPASAYLLPEARPAFDEICPVSYGDAEATLMPLTTFYQLLAQEELAKYTVTSRAQLLLLPRNTYINLET